MLRTGELGARTAERALEIGADLIIIARKDELDGRVATALANLTEVPVWIASEFGRRGPVLAATDLEGDRHAVLRYGVEYARCLDVPLVLLHNMVPVMEAVPSSGGGRAVIVDPKASLFAARHAALLEAASEIEAEAARVVVSRALSDDAILEIARRHGAELVALGARRVLESSPREGIAERVVARAAWLSVLLVPIAVPEAWRYPSRPTP